FEVEDHPPGDAPCVQVLQRVVSLVTGARLNRQRPEFLFLRERDYFLQFLQIADIRADDADGALGDRRQRMDQLAPVQPDQDIAAALAQRGDAKRGGGRRADEI